MTRPTSDVSRIGTISEDNKDARVPIHNQEELKQWFIGSIDQGTTSTRFLIFDGTGSPIASHQLEFKQMYPHSGSVQAYRRRHHNANVDHYADG